jgi:carbon dioxide concentrating mechanism protein CcmO
MLTDSLGILETTGLTPALVALDAMEKGASIQVIQAELNDFYGVVLKIRGGSADVRDALEAGRAVAERMGGKPHILAIDRTDREAWKGIESRVEYNPLIQQNIVFQLSVPGEGPSGEAVADGASGTASGAEAESKSPSLPETTAQNKQITQIKESSVSEHPPLALGLIETQGFTAVFEAIDTACKAANVEVVGKEKLGGGYITIVIQGDVAAVKAAIQAGSEKVEGLGKLIAAHVIARPSSSVLALLPKI